LKKRGRLVYHVGVKQFEAPILENRAIAESWRELVLAWEPAPPEGGAAEEPLPGQFLTIRVSPYSDPLLRRPFAFSGYAPPRPGATARASVIYQIRGGATRLLSELAMGSRIDCLGALGKPFSLPSAGEYPVLAGGGRGLGPLLILSASLTAAGRPHRLVLGVRSASLLPTIALPEGTVLCTDDGSSGFKGTPVDWIGRELAGPTRIYGCGPSPMLAGLAALAAERGWRASLSAEQWMACGVGACMGCALPPADGKG
jgi:dihydroorotate dehydrogenase electron transfer subunit